MYSFVRPLTLCFSMFLIHLMACPCGSIMSGQRLLVVTMTPFSVENESEGRPWMFQSLTDVALAKNWENEKLGEQGMFNCLT